MTCKQCKNYDECQFDAACNDVVFDPDASAEYCTAADPITNADRIRAMSDEELAAFIGFNSLCDRIQDDSGWCENRGVCDGCLVEWLQQPAGEE